MGYVKILLLLSILMVYSVLTCVIEEILLTNLCASCVPIQSN